MSPASQPIEFEGYFADLRDLAAVSIPYELSDEAESGWIVGLQRQLNEKHALDLRNTLNKATTGSFRKLFCPFAVCSIIRADIPTPAFSVGGFKGKL